MLGDVSHPELVGTISGELPEDEVVEDRMQSPRAARTPVTAPMYALQAQGAHEALDALPRAPHAVTKPQLGVDARAAVGAVAALVRFAD